MLQQTQAGRVVPHYTRFVEAFPTPAACAAAGAGTTVRMWSGLGYNRRALNLHRAATTMVDLYGGDVPRQDQELRALAGVGAYTARAVRAFAFAEDVAAVDTNAVRVFARAACPEVRSQCAGPPSSGTRRCPWGPGGISTRRCSTWAPRSARPAIRRVRALPPPRVSAPGVGPVRIPAGPTRGGSDRRHAGRAPSPGPTDRGGGGCSTPFSTAGCDGWTWPARVAGRPRPSAPRRVAAALVSEGFAEWSGARGAVLRLR